MRSSKAPDLNAPRFRKKVYNTLSKKFIKNLKEETPALKSISEEDIKNIILEFNETLTKTVIEVRDGVELPEQLGHIFIGSCKPMKTNIDYKKTAEYLKHIQHRNWESDERIAKIFYTSSGVFFTKKSVLRYKFRNQELWGFRGCRDFTRAVSANFPKKWKQYVEIDPTKKLTYIYLKELLHEKGAKYNNEIIETYNPFE